MKVGVLTSSRADFGIYIPLLKKIKEDSYFDLDVIAFGTHLSVSHGYTIKEIEQYKLGTIRQIETTPKGDSLENISHLMGEIIQKFSKFWASNSYDLVICLGDRYEMFAAVSAATPFNMKFAHIHAGETTLGAIDNGYRHSISHFSKILFVSTEQYLQRASEIVEKDVEIHNVGALSIDNLANVELLSLDEFKELFDIDLSIPTILCTFHPETVNSHNNKYFVEQLLNSFTKLTSSYQIVVTLPNADQMGQTIRNEILEYNNIHKTLKVIESFGMRGYLTCMQNCAFMLGNSSSGFVEASYFPKIVINLGERQKGRLITENIISCEIEKEAILEAVNQVVEKRIDVNKYAYGKGNAAQQIVEILKKI